MNHFISCQVPMWPLQKRLVSTHIATSRHSNMDSLIDTRRMNVYWKIPISCHLSCYAVLLLLVSLSIASNRITQLNFCDSTGTLIWPVIQNLDLRYNTLQLLTRQQQWKTSGVFSSCVCFI